MSVCSGQNTPALTVDRTPPAATVDRTPQLPQWTEHPSSNSGQNTPAPTVDRTPQLSQWTEHPSSHSGQNTPAPTVDRTPPALTIQQLSSTLVKLWEAQHCRLHKGLQPVHFCVFSCLSHSAIPPSLVPFHALAPISCSVRRGVAGYTSSPQPSREAMSLVLLAYWRRTEWVVVENSSVSVAIVIKLI